jgi:hypothetical protein
VVWEGGAVEAYLNTGQLAPSGKGDGRNWREKMVIAPGINGVLGDKIRFADIDGTYCEQTRSILCYRMGAGMPFSADNTI